ncbi:hypothetical protein [Curtobacterium sp. MCPF17_052]|uniref:hypothetical protein n=1 Tax=Curtobacterium sp. MCPF17_052 TaxID=2175655 RepID=UPI0024E00A62|nr:hypothetical protein [Curtobacterium sp. MCPF17_052]WIB13551.1 hypothetical protein DEJ36_07300 [Curtobacterium sp. MCPF17_052]
MTQLGYDRFAVSGGDIGSGVARWLAIDHADRVIAVHRVDAGMPVFAGDPAELSAAERTFLSTANEWRDAEGAYGAMHRTKPQTAAVGLTDSPAGLAAWIVEKLRSWSDCDGDLWSVYSRDDVLGLLTEYWVTGTIGSSMRMYHANAAVPPSEQARRVEVPSGFTLFPVDLVRPPAGVAGANDEPRLVLGSATRRALRPGRAAGSVRVGAAPVPRGLTGRHPVLTGRVAAHDAGRDGREARGWVATGLPSVRG